MHRLSKVLLLVLFLGAALPAATWVPLKNGATPGDKPQIKVLSADVKGTTLQITVPGFWAEKTASGWQFRLPGELVSMAEGRPELPFLDCTLAMPQLKTPTFELISATYSVPGSFKVRMAPKAELEGQTSQSPAPISPAIDFPADPVVLMHQGFMREIPLCTLQLHPFKATGDGTLISAAAKMVVRINHTNPPGAWPGMEIPSRFRPVIEATCHNHSAIVAGASAIDGPATEYLVIGPATLKTGVQPLLDWRTEQGYVTEFVGLTSTSATAAKAIIQNRYAAGKLEFVLILGDYAQLPYYTWLSTKSDSWYACLTGGTAPDHYPDIGLGRLCGTTASVIKHQAAKIVMYETAPPSGSWYTKTILAAHKEQAPGKYVGCCEQIAAGPLATSGWTVYKQYGHIATTSNAKVSSYINTGVGIANYRGHGSNTNWVSGWCTSGGAYDISKVNALTNGAMTPIVFNIACNNGNFQTSCLQESWMQAKCGAVASLGAIQPSYTTANHTYDKELYIGIFGSNLNNIYDFTYKATSAIIAMGSAGQKNARMYWWGGDAATCVWTKVPSTLTVTHPSSISTTTTNTAVIVKIGTTPLANARVCLYKAGQLHADTLTNSTGIASFPLLGLTTGTIKVTVTAKNCKPYRGTIAVTGGSSGLSCISPASYAKVEGNSNNSFPFNASYPKFSYMQIHDDLPAKTMQISAIGFRRDLTTSSSWVVPAWAATMTVKASTSRYNSGKASTIFAANHGKDLTTLVNNQLIKFPPSSGGPMPKLFVNQIPFAKPFYFASSFKVRSLCWELRVHGHNLPTGKTPLHDCARGTVNYSKTYFGTGGKATGQTRNSYNYAYMTSDAGGIKLYGSQYYTGKNETPFQIIGVSDKIWGFLKLPFDLGSMGGTGNKLYTDVVFLSIGSGKTSSSGGFSWLNPPNCLIFPAVPGMIGMPLFIQHGSTDLGNKSFPFVFTRAAKLTLGAMPSAVPVTRIYKANTDTSTTGSVNTQNGLVTQFTYK